MWGSPRGLIVTATKLTAWAALSCALSTCSHSAQLGDEGPARVRLAAAAPVESGAAAVRLDVLSCDQDRLILSTRVGLAPSDRARLGSFGQMPVSLLTDHLFGRLQLGLEQGCHRIRATPVDARGTPLAECRSAKTPPIPMGRATRHDLMLLPRCSDRPFHVPVVDGHPNFAPVISGLYAPDGRAMPGRREVCVRARDPEADAVAFEWAASDISGAPVAFEVTGAVRQVGDESRECIRLRARGRSVRVTVVARDGARRRHRGVATHGTFASHEALRAYRHGVVAPSRSSRTLRLDPYDL
jgi:hypothetical protein